MPAYLGIDVGGTASRWVVADGGGTIVARGSAPGATGHLFSPAERARFEATLASIADGFRPHRPVAAYLGITGLGDLVHDDVRDIVRSLFGIEPERTRMSDDMELAFRATFPPGAGHLVSAGTGSIGLHITAAGDVIRVGGRGLLIDDGGSGTWIALRAIREVYRRIDENGNPGDGAVLATELAKTIGGEGWDAARSFVYGSDRGRIGALAQAVASAATRSDPVADDILRQAASEIVRLARALRKRAGPLPAAFIGGVITLHPSMKPAIEAELEGWTVTFPVVDAAAHAATLALDQG